MKTKLEIIDETEAAYSDPRNRGIGCDRFSSVDICVYVTVDGKMCAVGRCMIEPSPRMVGGADILLMENDNRAGMLRLNLEEVLKPEYRGHPVSFWRSLQMWHDLPDNFTETSISEMGRQSLGLLRKRYEI